MSTNILQKITLKASADTALSNGECSLTIYTYKLLVCIITIFISYNYQHTNNLINSYSSVFYLYVFIVINSEPWMIGFPILQYTNIIIGNLTKHETIVVVA